MRLQSGIRILHGGTAPPVALGGRSGHSTHGCSGLRPCVWLSSVFLELSGVWRFLILVQKCSMALGYLGLGEKLGFLHPLQA